jgi:hypothetical protein
MDVLRGIEDDQHRAAADLAVVVIFGGHLRLGRDGDLECLETGGAGDGEGVHGKWKVPSDQWETVSTKSG